MKKILPITAAFAFVFFSLNISAIMITSHNDGPEDVFKNPAVSAFSKNSWMLIADYKVLDQVMTDDLSIDGSSYDYEMENKKVYDGSFTFGNTGDLSASTKYLFYIAGGEDYLFKYKEDESSIGSSETTTTTEYSVNPKIVFGFAKNITDQLSYGLALNSEYSYYHSDSKKDDGATIETTVDTNHTASTELEFGMYLKSVEYNSELGFTLTSGKCVYSKSSRIMKDSSSGVKNEKNLINMFEYVSAPQVGLGAFIFLTENFGIGFEGMLELPVQYETKSISDELPLETSDWIIEKSPLIMNRIILSYQFSQNASVQTGFSKIYMYTASHDKDYLLVSESEYNFYSADILFKISTAGGMSYYAGATYDFGTFEAKINNNVAPQTIEMKAGNQAAKFSLGIGKSY